MKKTTLSFICCILLAALYSCNVSDKHKPLVAGIQKIVEKETGVSLDIDNSGYAEGSSTSQTEKLEIPATLNGTPEQILYRTGYTASYNKTTKLPNWVAWHLTAANTKGDVKRPRKAFHEDEDVPEPRATDGDYYNSGFDRGHMCPAADNKWSEDAMYQSFLFTNMCPQNHNLNIGDWNEMENACRKWAKKFGDIYIVCGPILYKGKHKTIGSNKVVVPEAFFKVVLCMNGTPKAIGFIYKNQAGNRPKGDYVNTIDQVERITGYDFFPALPDDIEEKVEASCNLDDWME
ncbi:MAG: DNA/RNA non-specific endonuclease [Prevotellaceae bacterium]|nr:DNA/RNA non-specific endonuclease [Prevotellaceae bacterium]